MTGNNGKPIDVEDPFARKLVGRYLDNRKHDIEKLTAALRASDFETIRTIGHNLYGSGAAYGLDDISWIGASIEDAAKLGDSERIERVIDELRAFLVRLKVL